MNMSRRLIGLVALSFTLVIVLAFREAGVRPISSVKKQYSRSETPQQDTKPTLTQASGVSANSNLTSLTPEELESLHTLALKDGPEAILQALAYDKTMQRRQALALALSVWSQQAPLESLRWLLENSGSLSSLGIDPEWIPNEVFQQGFRVWGKQNFLAAVEAPWHVAAHVHRFSAYEGLWEAAKEMGDASLLSRSLASTGKLQRSDEAVLSHLLGDYTTAQQITHELTDSSQQQALKKWLKSRDLSR